MAERDSPTPPASTPGSSPPSSPPFYGFGPETVIPERIIIETTGRDEDEKVVNVFRKKRTGRPRGQKSTSRVNPSDILDTTTRSGIPLPDQVDLLSPARADSAPAMSSSPARFSSKAASSSTSVPKHSSNPGTRSRPKLFLLDNPCSSLGFVKLPKNKDVLSIFLSLLSNSTPDKAAAETACKVKEVWLHHFGPRMILGVDMNEEVKKMIVDDKHIKVKITGVWKEWKELDRISKREDRANKVEFLNMKEKFVNEVLEMPLNILRVNYEEILKNESGIKDCREDLMHLHYQLQREQVGCCDSRDYKQRKRDSRVAADKLSLERLREVVGPNMDQIEGDDDDICVDLKDKEKDGNFESERI